MRHVILQIDLQSPLAAQVTYCACGDTITVGPFLTLEAAWNDHRGAPVATASYDTPQATDSEVEEFLRRVADPHYTTPVESYPAAALTERDTDTVEYLMERLLDEHWPREIYDCGVCRSLARMDARMRGAA